LEIKIKKPHRRSGSTGGKNKNVTVVSLSAWPHVTLLTGYA
jgi:hypothetical protein